MTSVELSEQDLLSLVVARPPASSPLPEEPVETKQEERDDRAVIDIVEEEEEELVDL